MAEMSNESDSSRTLSCMSSQTHSNDRGGRGLRLLSIDGGGIRGLSSLLILKEILYRMQQVYSLPQLPRPCDIFDLAGGTSTGGITIIMLFRLQMPIDDAIDAYATLAREVFSQKKWFFQNGTFKASRLEAALLDIIQSKLDIEEARAREVRMLNEQGSKCFVCAMPAEDLRYPTLFRSWRPAEHPNYDCTILEAARATTAGPSFFKGIKIGGPIKQKYIDGGLQCNNPVKYVIEQARALFGQNYPVSCVISLGTGTENVIGLEQPDAFQKIIPTKLISVLKRIAGDCEKISEEAATDLSQSIHQPLYVRLNVNHDLQNVSLAEWEKMPDVQAHTQSYLQTRDVNAKVDMSVRALNGTLAELPPPIVRLTSNERQSFDRLEGSIAISALHDSREQSIASVHIAGTRTAEIESIMRFIEGNDKSKPLLVVLGPAGSGKTWLMGSIARICKETGQNAASFFFAKNEFERNTEARLVTTLTYQIAVAIPDLQPYIARAIGVDSTILARSLETQLSTLLLGPINRYVSDHPNISLPPCVLLIDALDECGTHEIQRHVISKLGEAFCKDSFPFRCILSSRFDSHGLDDIFSREPIQQLVDQKVILGTALPAEMDDIRSYLVARTDQLRRGHRFASSIPKDWPSDSDLDAIVKKSGGQFIYAATVLRYIDSPIHKPQERLQDILGMQTVRSDNRPFAALDELYGALLSSIEDIDGALLFLAVELARSCPQLWIPETFSDDDGEFLKRQFIDWDADVALAPLAPVLCCQNSSIQLHHLTFAEFLFDSSRSGHFGDQVQQCQTWIVGQLVQFFYDGGFVFQKDIEYLINKATPGTAIHQAVEMGAEVVLDQPDPLPARGIFNIWPFVAKAFLVELNLSIFNSDLFKIFHQHGDHIPLSILMELVLKYGFKNFFIALELSRTCIILQQQGFVEVDWRLSRPDHDRLVLFMEYLSGYLDDLQQTETVVPSDNYAYTTLRCLSYLQGSTSDIHPLLEQELTFLEIFGYSDDLHNNFGNLPQGALEVLPELLDRTPSPSHELLVALSKPFHSSESPSLFQKVETNIQIYLAQHSIQEL